MLRAIPSLVVLTTAMAWGVSSHAGGLGLDGASRGSVTIAAGPALGGGMGAGVGVGLGANTAVQPGGGVANAGVGLDAGVRAGANGKVTAEERMAATGAAGSTGAGVQADGGVNSATDGVGRVLGGVRDTGQTAGSAAARTGKRLTHGGKSGPGSVNNTVNSGVQGAANAKLDAGIQGGTTAR
ncbi:MAG TPA: hypothetical protein DCP03_16355 [Polaromonas sp.]|nr:hypothetical protein [Polaromonas sp.]